MVCNRGNHHRSGDGWAKSFAFQVQAFQSLKHLQNYSYKCGINSCFYHQPASPHGGSQQASLETFSLPLYSVLSSFNEMIWTFPVTWCGGWKSPRGPTMWPFCKHEDWKKKTTKSPKRFVCWNWCCEHWRVLYRLWYRTYRMLSWIFISKYLLSGSWCR